VICTNCNKVSNQFKNMMDLIVEIHGYVASLEECLDQFTVKEWLEGDNKYKCDGCNDYVLLVWKWLHINMAPNILTIALKRFQVLALEYLNSLNIIHRDLKPDNLLIGPDGHINVAISFLVQLKTHRGLLTNISQYTYVRDNEVTPEHRQKHSVVGTPNYLAPEILLGVGHGWNLTYVFDIAQEDDSIIGMTVCDEDDEWMTHSHE
ncbi:ubiquitin carboxyl-terminal hydrolase 18, partial [Tanacetum coccineum]